MSVTITPVGPVAPVQSAGSVPTLVLQPGSVIDAQVINVLEGNLVRIAIADLSVEVTSQVPLQAGAALRLAVSQNADGIQLAIVPADTPATPTAGAAVVSDAAAAATTTLTPQATTASPTASQVLTPAQAAAVASATQSAAARQSGLSSLFADVAAAVDSLPVPLQQAAAQLLAARPALSTALGAGDIQSAFANSGLFLEAGLASGVPLPGQAGGAPDLKASLLVFRQLLSTFADDSTAPLTADAVGPVAAVAATTDATARGGGAAANAEEMVLALLGGESGKTVSTSAMGSVFAGLEDLEAGAAAQTAANAALASGASRTTPLNGTEAPPPPYRGAAPAAQPVASSAITANMASQDVIHRLADDTDGAIARQTLMQIASLPGQGTGAADRAAPQWNFEIPFATPQGTAVAQFEISGDGGGQTVAGGQRVWRARFSLNVEPTGPVHAMISLTGSTTSVRMWAERPQTATQLRANASQLTVALRQADLEPGDIVIGDGPPPRLSAAAPAGHFLDRAT